jgi:hypothetical protein
MVAASRVIGFTSYLTFCVCVLPRPTLVRSCIWNATSEGSIQYTSLNYRTHVLFVFSVSVSPLKRNIV